MARQLPTGAPRKTGSDENIVSPVDTSWMDSIFTANWFTGLDDDVKKKFRDFLTEWTERSANAQVRERESVIDAQKAKTEAVEATTDTMKKSFIRDSVLRDRRREADLKGRQRGGYRTLQQRIDEATDPEAREYYQDIQNEKLESLGYRNEGGYGSYTQWKRANPNISLRGWRNAHYGDLKPIYIDTVKEAKQAWAEKSIKTNQKDSKGNPVYISRDDAMKQEIRAMRERAASEGRPVNAKYHGRGVITFGSKADELARKMNEGTAGIYADEKGGRVMRERGWLDSFFNRTRVQTAAKAGKSRRELSRLLNRRRPNG